MRTILIFRQTLLPITETFVHAQAEALKSFSPRYIGFQPAIPSLPVGDNPILLAKTRSYLSRARKALYAYTGRSAHFHQKAAAANASLLQAQFGPDGAAALPLARHLNIPLVVTLHGYDVTMHDEYRARTLSGRLYLSRRPELWQRASLFLCVSEHIREKAIEIGFPKEKVRTHYIGIDTAAFTPQLKPQQNIVLFVGRLIPNKGCAHLIEAMQHVQRNHPCAKLVVVGDGRLRALLEKKASDMKVNCEFVGAQPTAIVREWIQRATVLCAPSITAANGESEGLGMVSLEAQAMGRPVVGFRTGGIPEAIKHGETGLLANEGNSHELGESILRYLSEDAFWQASSKRAVEWIAERFNLQKQTRILERFYEECLSSQIN
jgi:colanic acid/amylovoran biosynthesis glycosyltransferase